MTKDIIALADFDHDCRGFQGYDGCSICTAAFFARSKQKWNRLQERWGQVHKRAHQPDAMVMAAIMTPTEEEQ